MKAIESNNAAHTDQHVGREIRRQFEEQGFAVITEAVSSSVVDDLRDEADRMLRKSSSRGGVRNLLIRSKRFVSESEQGLPSKIAKVLLGPAARPTKLTLFNKTPAANWLIRWHQDLNVSVRERIDVPGFSAWSVKDGVVHTRPPAAILEKVAAIRLHLDDTPASNGALRVLAGSHRFGRLSRETIQRYREDHPEIVCEVPRGGLMVMSPLLLHASSKSSSPQNRRVLHFEYSAEPLPGGLQWA